MNKRRLMPTWFAAMATFSLGVIACGTWQPCTEQTCVTPATTCEVQAQDEMAETNVTLENYFWIDAIPRDAYTPFNAYLFTDNIGLNNKFASSFKVLMEIFEYRADKKQVAFRFPHDNRKASTSYSIVEYKNPKYPFLTAELILDKDPQSNGAKASYYTGPDLKINAQRNLNNEAIYGAMDLTRAQLEHGIHPYTITPKSINTVCRY